MRVYAYIHGDLLKSYVLVLMILVKKFEQNSVKNVAMSDFMFKIGHYTCFIFRIFDCLEYSLLKSDQYAENPIDLDLDLDLDQKPISTAAFAVNEEPEQLHQGKRRLKENYTSHWDLDYLPRKEVDKILAEIQNRNP